MQVIQEQGYYVCHNGNGIIQYFDLSNGGKLYPALENVELFATKQEAVDRVNELAGNSNYFADNFEKPEQPA